MKQLSLIVLIAVALICGCKQKAKEETTSEERTINRKAKTIYNKEFDWTMTVPAGFRSMTTEQVGKLLKKDGETGSSLFGFQRRQNTYFLANWESFDPAEDGDYDKIVQSMNEAIYKAHEARAPRAELDSFSATEVISGMDFPVFRIKIRKANETTGWRYSEYMYYRKLFGKKELMVYIASIDRNDQLDIMAAWRQSKFGADNR